MEATDGSASTGAKLVLVVEDDVALGRQLVSALRGAGFLVELANDVPQAETALRRTVERPALVVLDLSLPSGSGVDLLERFAGGERAAVPMLVLTARTDLQVRLRCFALGAVDYLAKPFFLEELVARIRARLGEPAKMPAQSVSWGELTVDLGDRSVRRGGTLVTLTRTEAAVLFCLLRRPGAAVSRDTIATRALAGAGEGDEDSGPRAVDSHVARLRKKLGGEGAAIRTVWGIGYRFEPDRVSVDVGDGRETGR